MVVETVLIIPMASFRFSVMARCTRHDFEA